MKKNVKNIIRVIVIAVVSVSLSSCMTTLRAHEKLQVKYGCTYYAFK